MRRCANDPSLASVLVRLARPALIALASAGVLAILFATAASQALAAGAEPAPARIVERAADAATAVAPRGAGEVPRLDEAQAVRIGQAAIGREVPDLVLLDRQGRKVRLTDYRGKPLLVSFIYTGCFQVCPTQTRALLDAVNGLETLIGADRIHIVSIGFNQPFDDPQAMRAFAAQQRIQVPNWEFLSPPRESVDALTRAFGFSYVATPAGFDHLLGVTVVDAAGRIHAQVYGDRLRADQIGKPLRELMLGAPVQADSLLAAAVERVRILCTRYDADTGEYRYDYKLILELIGGALFFGSVAIYLLLEWRSQRRARKSTCPLSDASGSMA